MASATYRFDEFHLDPARRELRRCDEKRELPLRAFQCLLYLLENRDRAVSHDELIEQVWGGAHMSDGVVAQAILSARRAVDDTAQEPRFIDTVRGFGYRWAAPVDVETVGEPPDDSVGGRTYDAGASAANRRRAKLQPWMLALCLVLVCLVIVVITRSRKVDSAAVQEPLYPTKGHLALMLPVVVDADTDDAWARLGVMDLIAQRLQRTGQPMVPSDSVIALMHGVASTPNAGELDRMTAATGAHLVLGARAEALGARWRVSLHSLVGARPALTAVGEAYDLLHAARIAADEMARSLGLPSPPLEPDGDSDLAMLLQRTEAAMLAQQMDVARELIETARPELRFRPPIRVQLARIEGNSGQHDAARTRFELLLHDPLIARDPVLHVRTLHGLGVAHIWLGDLEDAERLLEEAVRITRTRATLGRLRIYLSTVAILRGNAQAAMEYLAQARVALEGTGDIVGLAFLQNNLGVVETQFEHYDDALFHFESAASRASALHRVLTELNSRANIVHVHLGRLDPQAASAAASQVNELSGQTTHSDYLANARLAQAYLFAARGRLSAADDLLGSILRTEALDGLQQMVRMGALLLRSELAMSKGEAKNAARFAMEAVALPVRGPVNLLGGGPAHARLILVRAHLARNDIVAASQAVAAMADWVAGNPSPAAAIYESLAGAELAAAQGEIEAAEAAFDHAWTAAEASRTPLRMLHVAKSYVPFLLATRHRPERTVLVTHRLARYADQHYGAAMLQLRVYHALGPPAAWRSALERAQSLAGERVIPPELLVPPREP